MPYAGINRVTCALKFRNDLRPTIFRKSAKSNPKAYES